MLLRRLAARYPDCFTFACAGLVGATPELLIRRDGGEVSSLVLAGTMPRGATPAEDARLAATLLGVREGERGARLRRRLAARTRSRRCARRCEIAPRPELITFANVQHLGTRVRGTLAADRSALALAAALHPTAAVGGTPTDAAVELIRELENMDRERYAGPVGWVDADGNGEWGIALRCAQLDRGPGAAVRRVRHRGGLRPGRRAGRDAGKVPADADRPGAGRLTSRDQRGTAIAVSIRPPAASQRPAKLAGKLRFGSARLGNAPVKVPSGVIVTSASSKPSERPVSGNHAL